MADINSEFKEQLKQEIIAELAAVVAEDIKKNNEIILDITKRDLQIGLKRQMEQLLDLNFGENGFIGNKKKDNLRKTANQALLDVGMAILRSRSRNG